MLQEPKLLQKEQFVFLYYHLLLVGGVIFYTHVMLVSNGLPT